MLIERCMASILSESGTWRWEAGKLWEVSLGF